jgi:hypothetical protein
LGFGKEGDGGAKVLIECLGDEEPGKVRYAGDEAGRVGGFGGGDAVFAPDYGVDLWVLVSGWLQS